MIGEIIPPNANTKCKVCMYVFTSCARRCNRTAFATENRKQLKLVHVSKIDNTCTCVHVCMHKIDIRFVFIPPVVCRRIHV